MVDKTARDRHLQEVKHILQRIEQENSMEYSQIGNSNQNKVAPQAM